VSRGSQTLAHLPLFASLNAEDVRALDARCLWRTVNAGQWVIDDHSDGTDVFFILHGHARVVIGTLGREIILRDIHDGEYFGELSAIDGRPRSAGIIAIADTLVARMSANVFREAVHRHPSVCDQVMATLVTAIRTLTHAELAARISTHREAVTKILNSLEREGAITRTRGAIALTNIAHLRRVVAEAG
jgi:CRP/FNR family cyclic AMP-dependent transcriptional regulator